eukprot:8108689-Ditylum_brightwellii.AAC.1
MTSTASAYEVTVLDKTLNCATAPSTLNGNNERLGLAMPVAQYQTRNGGNPYVASLNHPGTYNNTIAANAGRVLQSRREVAHK